MEQLTKEEIKIISLFREDLLRRYTTREIMKHLSKKSYNWVFRAVEKLRNQGILSMSRAGHSNIVSINIENPLTITYLSFLEGIEANSRRLPIKNILEIINSIPLSYFSLIITGSYASGKSTEKSDLDIVLIVEEGVETRRLMNIVKNKGDIMIPEVHPYVFTKSEFLQMLLAKEENYAKLLVKNKIIFFGAESYYLILKEAIKNGFKG